MGVFEQQLVAWNKHGVLANLGILYSFVLSSALVSWKVFAKVLAVFHGFE